MFNIKLCAKTFVQQGHIFNTLCACKAKYQCKTSNWPKNEI